MRVVLDTNVLVSAALKRNSTPAAAVRTAQKCGVLLRSRATERQLLEVLARPYFISLIGRETRTWLRELMSAAEMIAVVERIVACRERTTSF